MNKEDEGLKGETTVGVAQQEKDEEKEEQDQEEHQHDIYQDWCFRVVCRHSQSYLHVPSTITNTTRHRTLIIHIPLITDAETLVGPWYRSGNRVVHPLAFVREAVEAVAYIIRVLRG